jgi:flagellar biosynthetic protein FliO
MTWLTSASLVALTLAAASSSGSEGGGFGFGAALLKTLVALALVCGVAYVLLRFGLSRLMGARVGRSQHLKIVDHCGLAAGQGLWLVEVGQRLLLVGSAERGLSLIREFDRSEVLSREVDTGVPDAVGEK